VLKLDSLAGLAAFCRDAGTYPIFAKPLMGSYGRGAFSILAYDPADDMLLIGDGERRPVAEAVAQFAEPVRGGYLFQELVEPNEATVAICGPKPTSARVVVLLGPKGPVLFRCVWKIPTGANMSDNFMHGETGNLLAHVDPSTGMVTRVISGVGPDLRELTHHPDTGACFADFVLPDWPHVRELCLKAGPCYPGMRMQHWDIALSDAGPKILEVNVEGSLDLHQLAGGRGVMDQDLTAALHMAEAGRRKRT
jgi:glutathione synthase/RimK-type ligase-like ATP-grasp enzyme